MAWVKDIVGPHGLSSIDVPVDEECRRRRMGICEPFELSYTIHRPLLKTDLLQ